MGTFMVIMIVIFILVFKWAIEKTKEHKETLLNGREAIEGELQKKRFVTTNQKDIEDNMEIIKSIKVDSENKNVAICDYEKGRIEFMEFDEILDCQLLEDSTVVCESGLGNAVVGAVVAGGVGAIVGSNTKKAEERVQELSIRIITSNVNNPQIVIPIVSGGWSRASSAYQKHLNEGREIYAIFSSIILSNQKKSG